MRIAVAELPDPPESIDLAGWKRAVSIISAILLGLLFLISGGWKVTDPFATGELLVQAQVPSGWGTIGAAALGTIELFTAFLLFVPRFRRWGGMLAAALLVFFIGWVGYYYSVLVGQECSCFPFIKRAVGPNFFIGDAVMLLMAIFAWIWSARSPTSRMIRPAIIALAALVVFAGMGYGVNAARRTGLEAPSPIAVDGQSQSIAQGKVFLFFFDPECMHCNEAARHMSKYNWGDAKVIAIPTRVQQFAGAFLQDTGLKAPVSLESDRLRKVFQFVDPPYAVALEDGHQKAAFDQAQFTESEPAASLKKLGFVQ